MSRSERLLTLLQVLRRHRRPVSAHTLATEIGVSIRTLYRDIASLQAQGAAIAGEPGVGYVMQPGFMLPPLMFRSEELDALVLGIRWVAEQPKSGNQTRRCDRPAARGNSGRAQAGHCLWGPGWSGHPACSVAFCTGVL